MSHLNICLLPSALPHLGDLVYHPPSCSSQKCLSHPRLLLPYPPLHTICPQASLWFYVSPYLFKFESASYLAQWLFWSLHLWLAPSLNSLGNVFPVIWSRSSLTQGSLMTSHHLLNKSTLLCKACRESPPGYGPEFCVASPPALSFLLAS